MLAVPLWLWGALLVAVLLIVTLAVMIWRSLRRTSKRKAMSTNDISDVVFIADKTREPFRPRTAPPSTQVQNEPGNPDGSSL